MRDCRGRVYAMEFIKFLKENDAFEKFVGELNRQREGKDQILRENSGITLITSAFYWVDACHGMSFWWDLNSKWISRHEEVSRGLRDFFFYQNIIKSKNKVW